ncbi:F-box/WD repeat-containing protein 4 [Uranotaenia lowii]|uniref:F-box/WD repeat-containing protein 4 n=1 Tax=Uranotaenia lowii TaxID=190385 RepID=UPI00247A0476|nr:F-box/WD repeat-containing protein 4 [Uranotaenia lowii]
MAAKGTQSPLTICDLNDDVLACIFGYLPLDDLDNLHRTCHRFRTVVRCYVYSRLSADLLRTGHRHRPEARRDLFNFDYRKRISLEANWRQGRYSEKYFFYHRLLYFPQIILERRWLYVTDQGQFRAHQRTPNGRMLLDRPTWTICSEKEPDINWVVKKKARLFGGRSDGTCFLYDFNTRQYRSEQLADDFITAVDFEGQHFVYSTKTRSTGFFTERDYEDWRLEPKRIVGEAYQTIKLCPDGGARLAAGKYHDPDKSALRLIDVESGSTTQMESPSRAVYQLTWKDSNTILTGNFDTTFRVVDTRTNKDEAVWVDPYDASVYCLDYDGANAVLCGMKYNFRVNLYDLRVPKRCVQMYFSSKNVSHYSPVYSLASDCSQLFVVTDHDLRILNFDADSSQAKDYTSDLNTWLY